MSVVVSPTPNFWVEQLHYPPSGGRLVTIQHFTDLAQERQNVLFTRFDQQLAVVLSDVLSEEIESIIDMRYQRFLL
ncbi:hypothetical protein D3C77_462430 [compost metagenome]